MQTVVNARTKSLLVAATPTEIREGNVVVIGDAIRQSGIPCQGSVCGNELRDLVIANPDLQVARVCVDIGDGRRDVLCHCVLDTQVRADGVWRLEVKLEALQP